MRKRVNLTLYPFGNAQLLRRNQVSEGYQFWHEDQRFPMVVCQHGPSECLGNMIQACAMDILHTQERYMPYLFCISSYPPNYSVELTSYACGTQLGVNMRSLKECTRSARGHQVMLSYGAASLRPELGRKYVPWVVINGEHSEQAERGNLFGVLCKVLSPRPSSCPKPDSAALIVDVRANPRDIAEPKAFEPCLRDVKPMRF